MNDIGMTYTIIEHATEFNDERYVVFYIGYRTQDDPSVFVRIDETMPLFTNEDAVARVVTALNYQLHVMYQR